MLHAIVIGIDNYRDPRITNLGSARADAEAVSRLLSEGILSSERTVLTLLDHDATRDAIVTAIGEILPRTHDVDDVVLIYYAGHGSPEQDRPPDKESRYLIPHDADRDRVFATGISLDLEFPALLDRSVAKRAFVILDACFSGRAGGRTLLPRRQVRGSLAPVSLNDLDLGEGRIVMAACRDDELAGELSDHGVFTKALLEAWPAGDGRTIGIGSLYEAVFARVVQASADTQHPVLKGHIEGLRLPRIVPS